MSRDQELIMLEAEVCDKDHGGPDNAAVIYGHFGDNGACLRLAGTDTWVKNPRELR